ncbi:MAG: hypothetical protein ACM3JH_10590 [Acidithiobacillales bacterium]
MPRKRPPCSECGSPNVAEILYGLIVPDEKLFEASQRGKIVFGGCCVTDHDPEWRCNACGAEFRSGRPEAGSPKPRTL